MSVKIRIEVHADDGMIGRPATSGEMADRIREAVENGELAALQGPTGDHGMLVYTVELADHSEVHFGSGKAIFVPETTTWSGE